MSPQLEAFVSFGEHESEIISEVLINFSIFKISSAVIFSAQIYFNVTFPLKRVAQWRRSGRGVRGAEAPEIFFRVIKMNVEYDYLHDEVCIIK